MPNWMKSVTSTPHNHDVAANAMFSTAQIASVCPMGHPSTTFAIFTAARFTDAMMKFALRRWLADSTLFDKSEV